MKKLFIFALIGLLTSNVLANVDFYGSARMGYWYEMMDENLTGTETRMNMSLLNYGTSRMGVNFKHDKILGKAEFGFTGTGNVYTRLLYGKIMINEDGCNLVIGQDYSGFNLANVASQGTSILLGYENMLLGYGVLYDGRHPMIKLTNKIGIFLSLASPRSIDAIGLGNNTIDAFIPKINIGYNLKNNNFSLHPTLGLNMSNYNPDFAGDRDEKIMSYVFATTIKYNLSNLALKGQFHYGQNIADYGIITSTIANAGWNAVDEEIINVTTLGGYLQLTYPIGLAKITGGAGYVISSSDALTDDDTGMSAFLQCNIKLYEKVSIIPEAGIIDDMENGMGVVEGSEIYFGTKLQLDF